MKLSASLELYQLSHCSEGPLNSTTTGFCHYPDCKSWPYFHRGKLPLLVKEAEKLSSRRDSSSTIMVVWLSGLLRQSLGSFISAVISTLNFAA